MSISAKANYARYAFILIAGLMLFRVATLVLSPVQLHGDEAQYWSWAQDLDWGYFSKPPMIAWVIAATTAVFGDAEWAVRLASPFLHAAIGAMLYLTGKELFDARTGFWAVLLYYLMPAVTLSSGIISTDVPLLLCWSVALCALVRLRAKPSWGWALILGASFGLGFLSKYAMLFFVPAIIIMLLMDKPARRALLNMRGLSAIMIAGLIILPNILWNAANDFATVSHTAANTNISGIPFHPLSVLEFWGEQTGVFGPLTIILYVLALIATWRGKLSANAKWLSLFVLAPLLVISLQALLSRANANWAVTSYIGGALLTAHYVVALLERKWIAKLGVGINAGLGVLVVTAALIPSFANQFDPMANSLKRTRGWVQTVDIVRETVKAGHEGERFQTIATDNRLVFYDLNYYGAEKSAPLRIWLNSTHINNHAEATRPLTADATEPILLVNYYEDYAAKFYEDFARLEPLDGIDIDLGGGKRRTLKIWAGYGYTPTTTRD